MFNVAIVGGAVSGRHLARKFLSEGAQVTIIDRGPLAQVHPPAGNGAASTCARIIEPSSDERRSEAERGAYVHYGKMARVAGSGIRRRRVLEYWDNQEQKAPAWNVPGLRELDDGELPRCCGIIGGICYWGFAIDAPRYLGYLGDLIVARGGNFVQGTVSSLEELTGYDVVCNCAGAWAAPFDVQDGSQISFRSGQIVDLQAAWQGSGIQMIQGRGRWGVNLGEGIVTVGAKNIPGVCSITPDPAAVPGIVGNFAELHRIHRNAKVLGTYIGVRAYHPDGPRIGVRRMNDGRRLVVQFWGWEGVGFIDTPYWSQSVARRVAELLGGSAGA